jgi:hypothetical protein
MMALYHTSLLYFPLYWQGEKTLAVVLILIDLEAG